MDRGLTPQRIDGHGTAAPIQQVEQLRDGGHLIRCVIDRDLARCQAVLRRPGADQRQRGLPVWAVVTALMRRAINGKHVRTHRLDGRDPLAKALLERFRVDAGKDPSKRIVGGDAVRHIQKLPQQAGLLTPNAATLTQSSTPQITAHMVMMMISRKLWAFVRSIRGSSTVAK